VSTSNATSGSAVVTPSHDVIGSRDLNEDEDGEDGKARQLTFTAGVPSYLACVAVGGYPPPEVRVHLGQVSELSCLLCLLKYCFKGQTPLHGHRLRTCCTTPPTDELTTILQQICHIAMPELNISTCQDVGMWRIFVRWWCRIVVSSSVAGVRWWCS